MTTRRQLLLALGTAALVSPLGLLAQKQGRVWRIGVLASRRGPGTDEWEKAYSLVPQRLRELGWVEGTNLAFDWRFAAGDYSLLPGFAAELVNLKVDLIVTEGSQGIRAAQGATRTIPIVFGGGTDLVANGFVKSLARPGGNTTGVTLFFDNIAGKLLELLSLAAPALGRTGVLVNPDSPPCFTQLRNYQAVAPRFKVELVPAEARTVAEIESAIARLAASKCKALIWTTDSLFIQQQRQIAELAARHRLPSVCLVTEYAEVGGLMGYGPDRRALWRRVAEHAGKILDGANPGEIPVEQARKLDLAINRKTARALGLDLPPELLLMADKVIE